MLIVESISVAYGQSRILTDVSLDVPDGSVVCLMGRNGVGKTTLMKCVMGLLKARSGKVTYQENNMTAWPPHRRARAGIGYVPQGRHIFPFLSIYENLLMGLEASRGDQRDGDALAEMYTLFPALKVNPAKLAGTLSGGQQQQLALARVLIRQPQLLLLDEPTEGLQPSIVQEIEDLIMGLRERQGTSVLLVEQSFDFVMAVADHCFLMEKGEIVLEGPTGTLDQNLMHQYLSV
ncbi:MAG TPA: urea ABC transporter ATP-binding subunit UrtE [Dehalococcoidia bacterium]|nr:urea ABC transporter ATP-binding subunit UrtE [Dehalococcoidia bacterium]